MPAMAAWPGSALAQAGPSEKEAFEAAKSLGTVEAWDAFLSKLSPTGFHADLARAYVKKLSESDAKPRAPLLRGRRRLSPPTTIFRRRRAPGAAFCATAPGGELYRQIGSLKEGEPVTLMGRTDVPEDGFPLVRASSLGDRKDRLSMGRHLSARPEPTGPTCTRPVLSLDCRYSTSWTSRLAMCSPSQRMSTLEY